ncbi:MAG: hypothetical protein WBQ66_07105 [Blastocatellia bacterium]
MKRETMCSSSRQGSPSAGSAERRLATAGWLSLVLLAHLVCASLAAAQGDHPTRLLEPGEVNPGARLVAQVGHSKEIDLVAMSVDNRFVLSASEDGIRLWEAETGTELQHLPRLGALSLALSPDCNDVALGWEQGVNIWRLTDGSPKKSFSTAGPVVSVAFSPDGSQVLMATDDEARLCDVESGAIVRRFEGHLDLVLVAAFSADAKLIVTGSEDNTVRLWDVASGTEIMRFDESSHDVNSVAISNDGRYVLGGCLDGTARVWDALTGAMRSLGDPFPVEMVPWEDIGVAFSNDGRSVLSSCWEGTIIWDPATGVTIRRIESLQSPVVVSNDGNFLFGRTKGGMSDGISSRLIEFETGRVVRRFDGYGDPVIGISWSPDDRTLLTTHRSSGAVLWDFESGSPRLLATLQTNGTMLGAVFSPDGSKVLVAEMARGANSVPVRLMDARTGVELCRISPGSTPGVQGIHFRPVVDRNGSGVSFSPDGRFIAISIWGGAAVWDTSTGSVRLLPAQSEAGLVAVSPDGRRVLTNNAPEWFVRLWDTESGKEIRNYGAHVGTVSGLAFSPDGRNFATMNRLAPNSRNGLSASRHLAPRLWDVDTGTEVLQFQLDSKARPLSFRSVEFSADGRSIVARGMRVSVWDLLTGQLVRSGSLNSLPPGYQPGQPLPLEPTGVRLDEVPASNEQLGAYPEGNFTVLRDMTTRREMCRLIAFTDGSWAVIAPDSRYDASSLDGIRGLHWIAPDEPFKPLPIEIFMRQYYEPGLLPRLLSGEVLPPVPDLLSLDRAQPSVRIADITPSSVTPDAVDVRVEVTAAPRAATQGETTGGASPGVHDLRLFRDGRLVGCEPQTDGPVTLDADGKATVIFRDVGLPRLKQTAEVAFSAYAFNGDRVKSATDRRAHRLQPSPDKRKGRAYVVSIGVNTYDDPSLNLRYAVNDAVQLSSVVSDALRRTGAYESVVAVPLISDGLRRSVATKADIRNTLSLLAGVPIAPGAAKRIPNANRIRPAQPDDLVVITFAGHGYSDGRGNFYMAPSDVGRNARAQIASMGDGQPDALGRCISSDELSQWLRDVDAGDMVMVIDACQSASFTGPGFKPGPMGSRGLGQLAFDKRMKILATTQSDNVALEVAKLEHGLATYVLVSEGLEAAEADFKPKDAAIFLGEWLGYAVERVPGLQAEIESGKIRAFGKIQPRVVVRDAARQSDRDITHEAPTRSVQRPVLFDFSRLDRDVLLTQTNSPPAP